MTNAYDERPWLQYYPAGVPADITVPSVPVTRMLDDAAERFPKHKALVFLGTSLTYREVVAKVDAFAAALRGLGVRPGDRVALILPNCPQEVIAFYGVLRIGAIVVHHNPLYTAEEMHRQLVDSGAHAAVVLDRSYQTLAQAREGTALRHVIVTSLLPWLPVTKRMALSLPIERARSLRAELTADLPAAAGHDFDTLIAEADGDARQEPVDPDRDVALLQYTGGTTGHPKGAMLTHRNMVANAHQSARWLIDPRPGEESMLAVLPMFHVFGLTTCLLTPTLLGATMVLVPKFDIELVLTAIGKWRPTLFAGVPPIFSRVVAEAERRKVDLRSLRMCISGAMPMSRKDAEDFHRVTGVRLAQGYGMTETSPIVLANPLDGNARHVSVGLPLPGTWAQVVDERDPTYLVPVGQAGELMVRGPQVFAGYWNRLAETTAVLRGGWLLTGDIATMSPDGYFTLVDRKRDMIIVNGFNVYPSEIEDVIRRHPAVLDCAVIGVPDATTGEAVMAFVVPDGEHLLTARDVTVHCAKHLVDYKVPRYVEARDDLPRDLLGKVLRRVLRADLDHHPR